MKLRDYQTKLINLVREEFLKGHRKIIAWLSTGGGKSAITIELIKNLLKNNKKIVFVVRRRQLVIDTARKFEKVGIRCGLNMGTMKGYDPSLPVQVCSIDTVRPKLIDGEFGLKEKYEFLKEFDSVVVDECLHKDTYVLTNQIGWKISRFEREPKENWPKVWTYNEKNKKRELKKVVRVIPREGIRQTYEVKTCLTKFKCTNNHLIHSTEGWKRLEELKKGDAVLVKEHTSRTVRVLSQERMAIFVGSILGDGCLRESSNNRYRISIVHDLKTQGEYAKFKAKVFGVDYKITKNKGFSDKLQVRFNSCVYYQKIKNKLDWALDNLERESLAYFVMDDGSAIKRNNKFFGFRLHTENFSFEENKKIQKTLKKKFDLTCEIKEYKNGYYFLNFKKNEAIALYRVVKNFIHEDIKYKFHQLETKNNLTIPKSEDRPALVIESIRKADVSKVYDLEIEDNHNFYVSSSKDTKNGILVHNCHDSTAPSYREFFANFKPGTIFLGLTATPFPVGNKVHDFWDSCVKSIEVKELIDQGYLVMPKIYVPVKQDLSKIKSTAGEYNQKQLADHMSKLKIIGEVVENYRKYGENKPAICFAVNKDHSRSLCEIFNASGIKAVHCDESTPQNERDESIAKLKRGEIKVLCNVNIFCLDEQTEILCKRGWLKSDDFDIEKDEVANFDDGKIFFSKAKGFVKRKRKEKEKMVSLISRHHNIRVTECHDILVKKTKYKKIKAKNLVGENFQYPICGESYPMNIRLPDFPKSKEKENIRIIKSSYYFRKKGFSKEEAKRKAIDLIKERDSMKYLSPQELTLDICFFIGLWIGDGSAPRVRGGTNEKRYSISQSTKYPFICKLIEETILKTGYHFSKHKRKSNIGADYYTWNLSRGSGYSTQKRKGIYEIEPYLNKDGTELFKAFTTEQIEKLIEGFWWADGLHGVREDINYNNLTITGTQKKLYDILQQVCICRNIQCWITKKPAPKNPNHNQQYTIVFKLRQKSKFKSVTTLGETLKIEENFKGENVWCVESESGNIITRRDGKVAITGNSTGVDVPEAEVGIMARPTRSETLWIQQAGRLLRPYRKCGRCKKQYDNSPKCYHCDYEHPDYIKEYAILIDHGNNTEMHGTPLDIRQAALTKEDRRHKDEKEDDAVICEGCYLVYDKSEKKCPACGKERVKTPKEEEEDYEKEVKHERGELRLLENYTPEPIELKRMRGKLATLKRKAQDRNWKPNAVWFQMYKHYGDACLKYPDLGMPEWIPKYAKKAEEEKKIREEEEEKKKEEERKTWEEEDKRRIEIREKKYKELSEVTKIINSELKRIEEKNATKKNYISKNDG